jgi:hypothetical protein
MSETGNVPAIHLLERADKQLYEVKAARKGSAPRSSSTLTTMPMKKSA